MTNLVDDIRAAAAGLLLGAFFFGGLWLTVRKAVDSQLPALWFAASFMIRVAVTLAGFYWVSAGSWQRLLLALAGFLLARFVLIRVVKPQATLQKGGVS